MGGTLFAPTSTTCLSRRQASVAAHGPALLSSLAGGMAGALFAPCPLILRVRGGRLSSGGWSSRAIGGQIAVGKGRGHHRDPRENSQKEMRARASTQALCCCWPRRPLIDLSRADQSFRRTPQGEAVEAVEAAVCSKWRTVSTSVLWRFFKVFSRSRGRLEGRLDIRGQFCRQAWHLQSNP